jgi:hypothetical protein
MTEGNTNWLLIAFCCLIPFCCVIPQCGGGGGSFLSTDAEWQQMSDEEKGKAIANLLRKHGGKTKKELN